MPLRRVKFRPGSSFRQAQFPLYRDYLIVAEGSVGNLRNLNFLIDTGTDSTIVDKNKAQRLHLKLQPARIGTLGTNTGSSRAILPSYRIGPITCLNCDVLVHDLSFLQHGLPRSLLSTHEHKLQRVFVNGEIPCPSLTKTIRFTGTSFIVSTWPLGHRISSRSTFSALPSPKCTRRSPWEK